MAQFGSYDLLDGPVSVTVTLLPSHKTKSGTVYLLCPFGVVLRTKSKKCAPPFPLSLSLRSLRLPHPPPFAAEAERSVLFPATSITIHSATATLRFAPGSKHQAA